MVYEIIKLSVSNIMIEVNEPTLNFIPENERQNGISLILRVKNGEDFEIMYFKCC
jgi:hypothetical protein